MKAGVMIKSIGIAATLMLCIFAIYPIESVLKFAFLQDDGQWGGGNFVYYTSYPGFLDALKHTLSLATWATLITVLLAYGYCFALHQACLPWRNFWRGIILLPLIVPSLMQALGVQFILGRNGLINQWFGTDLDVYGFWGILISNVVYALPHAFLVLQVALAASSAQQYEAAQLLGANQRRMFFSITLPQSRYGILSAMFLVFAINISEFGNPMVIGGDYNVLATEIYNQVVGQSNLNLGAVIGVFLLAPVVVTVLLEQYLAKRQAMIANANHEVHVPKPNLWRDRFFLLYVALIAVVIASIIVVVMVSSISKLWPYDLTPTLSHYTSGAFGGFDALKNSVEMSLLAALLGGIMVTLLAWAANTLPSTSAKIIQTLAIIPATIPGMILGFGYTLSFSSSEYFPSSMFAVIFLMSICTVYHYHAQAFAMLTNRLKQIDKSLEQASTMLGASTWRTFRLITLPLIWPAVVTVMVFYFIQGMVTLSALIFLVTPTTLLAAVSVLTLNDTGQLAQAAALSTSIMLMVLCSWLIYQAMMKIHQRRGIT